MRVLPHTPVILQKIGLSDCPILYKQTKLLSGMADKESSGFLGRNMHGIPRETMNKLPYNMEHPVLVADSPSRDDALVLVLHDIRQAIAARIDKYFARFISFPVRLVVVSFRICWQR